MFLPVKFSYSIDSTLLGSALFYSPKLFLFSICIYIHRCFNFNTDKPSAVNIRNPDDITNESIVVQWDAVDDIFPVTYNVTWYNESGIIGMDTVNGTSYNVTGLTANTSYNITVVAISTCGAGPVSNVIMTMTNMRPPTLPPPTTTLTASPTSGNIMLLLPYTMKLSRQKTFAYAVVNRYS